MSTLDLASLGVSAVDVATIQENIINQVKQSKKNALNKELETIQSNIQNLKQQIKTIGRILRNAKHKIINLSPKEIKSHLTKQKQLANELQTQIETKTQILNQLKFIDQTITNNTQNNTDSNNHNQHNHNNSNYEHIINDNNNNTLPEKRGKKRSHNEMINNETSNNNINTDNNNNQWQCTRCTLFNEISNIRCSICNTIKPRNLNHIIASDNSLTVESVSPPPNKKQKIKHSNKKQSKYKHKNVIYEPYRHNNDDADDDIYESRLKSFYKYKDELIKLRKKKQNVGDNININISENEEEIERKSNDFIPETFYDYSLGFIDIKSNKKFINIDNSNMINNCVPLWIYNHLYKFQRDGLKWLYKLFNEGVGGILGDDMGLGKTIQIISFLESLRIGLNGNGPALIICPGSVLIQWMREFHKWSPELRVMLLHDCGRHKSTNKEIIDKLYDSCLINIGNNNKYKDYCGGVIITTYTSLKINDSLLLPIKWGIVILDEGHKIRNPNAAITMICKQLKCRNRYIVSGSPLQNTLMDLWSLFDFIFPGKLATLPVFEDEFVTPIKMGGYSHATSLQIEESIATANILKNIIDPYILRRTKENVKKYFFIPNKTEQVLFCKLSDKQLLEYKNVLNSNEMKQIFENKQNNNNNYFFDKWDRNYEKQKNKLQTKGYQFKVITMLKKICNHCDLLLIKNGKIQNELPNDYGNINRSGKLKVLNVILNKWINNGNKSLIFCQTKQFLDIIETFIKYSHYKYLRLDGSTPIRNRQNLINKFNDNNSNIFILLLTTRAGGLGINLCGANRVIVMDPDWNPSTDSQAKERCYRIGQSKDVIIYRLITKGTIEEKIYHRQIYKQFLTDKVLKDPNNQRVFSQKDLKDLFSLNNNQNENSLGETHEMFDDLNASITKKDIIKMNNNLEKKINDETEILSLLFSSNGIGSAFRHNHIEELNENERIKLEKIAKKTAKKALKALQNERIKINNNNLISQPTWTGRNGFNHNIVNDNKKIKKFGNHRDLIHILRSKLDKNTNNNNCNNNNLPLSSASLLAQIKARKNVKEKKINMNINKGNNNGRKKIGDLKEKRYELLVFDLYNFVKNGNDGNGIRSDIIIQHFDHRLNNEQEQCIFKIMLQKMCKLTVNQKYGKCWILKDKYQSLSL